MGAIVEVGSSGAPTDADYLVKTANASLSAERVVTDTTGTTGVTWDWATAGQAKANATNAGKWIKLATATASASATVDFTWLTSAYIAYKVVFAHVAPASDGVSFYLRTSTDNGGAYDAGVSDYDWVALRWTGTTSAVSNDAADSEIELTGGATIGNASNENSSGCVILHNPTAALYGTATWLISTAFTTGALLCFSGSGRRLSAADVTAIRFLMSSGNIASGTFDLFGLAA